MIMSAVGFRNFIGSTSYRALQLFKKETAFSPISLKRAAAAVSAYPHWMRNAFSIERHLQKMGLFTCVHAQPAPFTLPNLVENALEGRKRNVAQLRSFDIQFQKSADAVRQKIAEAFQNGKD